MSDITSGSSSNAQAVKQSEQQAFEQSQENIPSDENKQRFAQKLQGQKQADNKKKAQKEEQNKENSKTQEQKSTQNTQQQAKAKAQEKSETKSLVGGKKAEQKDQSLMLKEKDSSKNNPLNPANNQGRADAILQNISGGQTTQATQATTQTQSANLQTTNTASSSTERLFSEFQSVADRVMLTENSLKQGGSIRLQLSENVLPGTSVTFAMVGGALHATFSGANKQSLDKILKHREKMAEHVQANSGVKIIVETKEEEQQDNAR